MPFEVTALDARLRWLVRLRWIAVVAVVGTIAAASALGRVAHAAPLYEWTAVLAAANAVFDFLNRRKAALEASAALQVVTDLIVLTFLMHFAGGSGNPFAFFYVFHVIIASILFAPRTAWLTAVLAAVLFGGLTAADLVTVPLACPRHPILGQPNEVSREFALGRLGAFAATVGAAAYFGTTIMSGLRRKEAELVESRERLAQSEKLAAIGELAAGIAHELNTPLGSILVAAEVTREGAAAGSEGAQMLGDIVRETKRCKEITRSLLDLARKRELKLEETDAGEVVKQAVELVKRESGARAGCVEVDVPRGLPSVRADAGALGQVVVNVLKNAIDAVEGRAGAKVRVLADCDMGEVKVRVEDNGPGIGKEALKRVFEPFYTTKEPGRGTGLGLPVSYAIMRDLKGEIAIESVEGRGTSVTLMLPIG